jgi:hypothetical protein
MLYSNWYYEPVCDWYIRYVTTYKDGEAYGHKEYAHYYYGKTNIPIVKRMKK